MANTTREEIIKRLNRVKGQVEGILRMVDRPKPAVDIFHQITAAKKALDSTGRLILENYIKDNLVSVSRPKEDGDKIREIIEIMEKF
jgi:CsoR family transcriptional regulator, copper-sensing transcriptional repressor